MIKRVLIVVGALLGAVIASAVLLFASAFIGTSDVKDGAVFADGKVVTVLDGFVAAYLVDVGGGKWAVVDAGNDPQGGAIKAALAARGAQTADLVAILLTHGHGDHVAGAKAFPGVRTYALAAELPLIVGEVAARSPMGTVRGAVDTGVRISEPLTDGQVIRVGDTDFEVLAVSGHTAGSTAYLVHGVLLVGDSVRATPEGELMAAPWLFSDDGAQNVASLAALASRLAPRKHSITALLPAHTGALSGLQPLLDFAAQ